MSEKKGDVKKSEEFFAHPVYARGKGVLKPEGADKKEKSQQGSPRIGATGVGRVKGQGGKKAQKDSSYFPPGRDLRKGQGIIFLKADENHGQNKEGKKPRRGVEDEKN
jgi:hypothetical protein